jgi:bifunctional UDP-N-acetylglucosamine pyrophosphorylase/glucosamine-1-phosphate N-acetyltransferase
LRRLSPENAQGEYYLTDVVEVLHDAGYGVHSVVVPDETDTRGVNDRVQLAAAEAELRRRTNERLLRAGVTMVDPDRTYVDATVQMANDVTLFPGTMLQGRCVIGAGAELGPDTRLVDCIVGAAAVIEHSVGRDAEVGAGAHVGPFSVLAPGAHVAGGARVEPFYTAGAAADSGG